MKYFFTTLVLISSLCFSGLSMSGALEKGYRATTSTASSPYTKERMLKTIELMNRLDTEKKQQWISKYREKRDNARNSRERAYYTAILRAVTGEE